MIEQLARRVRMMLSRGTVVASTDEKSSLGLQVQIGPYELRDNVPQVGMHGLVSHPLPGADVIVAFQGGDRSNPVVIGVNDQKRRRRQTQPGEIGLQDDQGMSVMILRAGIVVDGGGKPVTIQNAASVLIKTSSKVRIEGDLEVTGQVTAKVDGAAVHLSTHTHSDPQGGSVGQPQG